LTTGATSGQLENDNHDAGELLEGHQWKERPDCQTVLLFRTGLSCPSRIVVELNVRVPDRYIACGCESDGLALKELTTFLQAQGYVPE
jgi:hypothetical protein